MATKPWKTIQVGMPESATSAIINALNVVRGAVNYPVSIAEIMSRAPSRNFLTWLLKELEAQAVSEVVGSIANSPADAIRKILGTAGLQVIAWSATKEIDVYEVALANVGLDDDTLPPSGPTTLGTRVLDILVEESTAPSTFDRWLSNIERVAIARPRLHPSIVPVVIKDAGSSAVLFTVSGPSLAVVNRDYNLLRSVITRTHEVPEKETFEEIREGFKDFAHEGLLLHEANEALFSKAFPKEEKLDPLKFLGDWDDLLYGINKAVDHAISSSTNAGTLVDHGKFQSASVINRTLDILQENVLNLLSLQGAMLTASGDSVPDLFDNIRAQSNTRKDPVQITYAPEGSGLKVGQTVNRKKASEAGAGFFPSKHHYVAGIALIYPTKNGPADVIEEGLEDDLYESLEKITEVDYSDPGMRPSTPSTQGSTETTFDFGPSELWAIGPILDYAGTTKTTTLPRSIDGLGLGPAESFIKEWAAPSNPVPTRQYALTGDHLYSTAVQDRTEFTTETEPSPPWTEGRETFLVRDYITHEVIEVRARNAQGPVRKNAEQPTPNKVATIRLGPGNTYQAVEGDVEDITGGSFPAYYSGARTQDLTNLDPERWFYTGELETTTSTNKLKPISFQVEAGTNLYAENTLPQAQATDGLIAYTPWKAFTSRRPDTSNKSLIRSGTYLVKVPVPQAATPKTMLGVSMWCTITGTENKHTTLLRSRDILVQLSPAGDVLLRTRSQDGWDTEHLGTIDPVEEYTARIAFEPIIEEQPDDTYKPVGTRITVYIEDEFTYMSSIDTELHPLITGTYSVGYGYRQKEIEKVGPSLTERWSSAPPPIVLKETKLVRPIEPQAGS